MTKAAAPAPHGCQGTPAAMRRRTRALDAFIDLVLKGHLPPTVEQVAGQPRRDCAGQIIADLQLQTVPIAISGATLK